MVLEAVTKFYDSLKSAGHKPEAHIFSAGGHGFGMQKQGTSSDHWIDEFYYWLEAQGFTKPQQNKVIGLRLKITQAHVLPHSDRAD